MGAFVRTTLTGKGQLGRCRQEPPGRTALLTAAGLVSGTEDPPGCSVQRRDTLKTESHTRHAGHPSLATARPSAQYLTSGYRE